MRKSFALMIHGGAGELDSIRKSGDALPHLQSIRKILKHGQKLLKQGALALDVVEACAVLLETDTLFNAGRGSVLDERGKVSMDAAIMDGRTLDVGAVAGISRISHPVKLARLVLEKSNHVLLAGDGALRFARRHGMRTVRENYHVTAQRLAEYKTRSKATVLRNHGTIGAVAMDRHGNLAAAASTGGMVCKKQGRIGDTPVPGAGLYAANDLCAVAATGHGEMFLRTVLAKHIADLIAFRKMNAVAAATAAVAHLQRSVNGRGGVIVIDGKGRCGASFNTRTMVRGWITHDGAIHCTY